MFSGGVHVHLPFAQSCAQLTYKHVHTTFNLMRLFARKIAKILLFETTVLKETRGGYPKFVLYVPASLSEIMEQVHSSGKKVLVLLMIPED